MSASMRVTVSRTPSSVLLATPPRLRYSAIRGLLVRAAATAGRGAHPGRRPAPHEHRRADELARRRRRRVDAVGEEVDRGAGHLAQRLAHRGQLEGLPGRLL